MTSVLVHYVVPVIHVVACLFLIAVVLLQTGKGADMGAVFGGGSQTLFGSGGAGNLLTKLTTGTAIAFMVTSLVLTYGASRTPTSRLLERLPAATAEPGTLPAPAAGPDADAAAGEGAPAAEAGTETATAPVADAPAESAATEPVAAEPAAPAKADTPPAKPSAAEAAKPAPAADAPSAP
jgi:preprotein translocase subunit SecG